MTRVSWTRSRDTITLEVEFAGAFSFDHNVGIYIDTHPGRSTDEALTDRSSQLGLECVFGWRGWWELKVHASLPPEIAGANQQASHKLDVASAAC